MHHAAPQNKCHHFKRGSNRCPTGTRNLPSSHLPWGEGEGYQYECNKDGCRFGFRKIFKRPISRLVH